MREFELKQGLKVIDKKDMQVLEIAKQDYLELKDIVDKNNQLSLDEMSDRLEGYNMIYDENLFDVNYKSIVATVFFDTEENKLVLGHFIDIWYEEECVEIGFDISEVLDI